MTAVLGIDPGCSGALVVITQRGSYIDHLAMPTIKVGTKSRVNGAAVAAWIRQYGISHAYLEQVGAMPGQGTASMFTFGHAAGVAPNAGRFHPSISHAPNRHRSKPR